MTNVLFTVLGDQVPIWIGIDDISNCFKRKGNFAGEEHGHGSAVVIFN